MLSVDDVFEIIDYVEHFDEKGIQFVIMGSPVRGGVMLLHSLLDNHPQVLHLPIPFYYFFDWESTFQYSAPENLVDDFFSKSTTLSPGVPYLGPNRDIVLDLHFDLLSRVMKVVLPRLKAINRKTFLLLLHFVYAKLQGQDLKTVKVIFHHHHAVPNIFSYFSFLVSQQYYVDEAELAQLLQITSEKYRHEGDLFLQSVLEDFPNTKLLIPIRHPMATLHAGIEAYKSSFSERELSLAFLVYFMCLLGYYNLHPMGQWLGERCKLVKFENLHGNTEKTMQEIAAFIGIPFQESLLSTTFGGHPWSVAKTQSHTITGTDPQIPRQDTKWRDAWDPETLAFYGALCTPLYKAFQYPLETFPVVDLSKFIPEEEALYRDYPAFLKKTYDQVMEETASRPSSPRLNQVYEEQMTLYQERMRFWTNYPNIRQRILDYIHIAQRDLSSG